MPQLSVIIPVFNEVETVKQIIDKVNSVPIDKEVIVVDDGSTDGTDKLLREFENKNIKIIYHTSNRGKGAAFLTGLANATGEFVIIQDADLEYDPMEYVELFKYISSGEYDMVLGARFTKGYHGFLIPRLGNRFLTMLMNLLFKAKLNDFFTCYKLLRKDTLKSFNLKSQRFDIDVEIVVKAFKYKLRIKEVPISYNPRSYREGKKIRIIDGLKAILCIIISRLTKG